MELIGEPLNGRDPHEAGLALLRVLCGEPLPEVRRTERGKPFFPDDPRHFSISHTKSHVFCALSRYPIGIDAEEADRNIHLSLAEKILSPAEKEQFLLAPDPRRALLTFWVLKEAAAKCSGEGLRGYPNNTAFSLNDPRVRELHGCLVAVIEDDSNTR